mmetsp:Transcript_5156/g.19332  ORF Transcript_5156/g.19332 Transcript_5156/m.19332 type:complete len:165 (-) Transcript_5156:657-1151(-)
MSQLKFKSILIACDHAAFSVKQQLVQHLQSTYAISPYNIKIKDLGVYSEDRVDYPDIAKELCHTLLGTDVEDNSKDSLPYDGGILLCGSGIGISIAANRFGGIRAALCHDNYTARMSREHNNANVLCAGARVVGMEVLKDMVDVWLRTEFQGGRHATRVEKIEK